jgi:hypothetical protein
MAGKFYGPVGYAHSVETKPGVIVEEITEHTYYGDVTRKSRTLENDDKVNSDLTVNASINIMADAYANENYSAIRYVKLAGSYWKVAEVTPERPRLLLRLGGLYNGRKAPAPDAP